MPVKSSLLDVLTEGAWIVSLCFAAVSDMAKRQRGYGDSVPLVIEQAFHRPLQAMSGLAGSLVQLMGLDLVVPS